MQAAGINGSSSVARDNLSVTLEYPDGSLATLLYVAMGNKEMARERMEVFGQGTSMVLDDFRSLEVYGNQTEKISDERQDKGHAREFAELAELIARKTELSHNDRGGLRRHRADLQGGRSGEKERRGLISVVGLRD